jgi:hypothetical protein
MTPLRLPQMINLAFLSILSTSTYAVDQGIAPLGFSGALSTPMAKTLEVGQAAFAYSPYLDGMGIDVSGDNAVVGAGLLSHLEVFGRLASNHASQNCFQTNCGIRDLSASLKIQIPSLSPFLHLPSSKWMPHMAAGMTDIGGSSTYFRTSYGVATWDEAWWALSMGFSKASAQGQLKSRLDGVFGSVVVQPLPWLQGIVEHDGTALQGGLRVLSLPRWLPNGVQVQGEVRGGASKDHHADHALWWGLSARIPLAGWKPIAPMNESDRPQEKSVSHDDMTTVVPAVAQINPSSSSIQSDDHTPSDPAVNARQLSDHLSHAGFQNIRIGYDHGQWVVALENQAYAHNTLDALGVALGVWSAWSSIPTEHLLLILEQEGQPVLSIESDHACLTAWFHAGERCEAGVLRPISTQSYSQGWVVGQPWRVDARPWLVTGIQPMIWRPRVQLAPVLNYALATEYGNLDYSLGLATTVEVPVLWSGLLADVRYVTPLFDSPDYQQGGVFETDALHRGVDRAMLHQYIQIPQGWSAHAAFGRMFEHYDGVLTEGRWQSSTGAHKFGVLMGHFENNQSHQVAQPMVASYRYQFAQHDVQLSAQMGEFFDGDRGYVVSSRFAFADTFLSLFYRSTKNAQALNPQHYAGVQLSLPLTPWHINPTAFGQVKGTTEYNQSVQTEVGADINAVAGAGQRGRLAIAPQSLDLKLYNRDRLSIRYIDAHLERLRQAYLRSLPPQ